MEREKDLKEKYMKRLKEMKKKAMELSTLCDVEVCILSFNPFSSGSPDVWPDNADPSSQATRIIQRYLKHPPDKRKHSMLDLPAFWNELKANPKDQERQSRHCDPSYDWLKGFSEEELRNLAGILETKVEAAKRKLEGLAGGCFEQGRVQKRAKIEISSQDQKNGGILEKQLPSVSCLGLEDQPAPPVSSVAQEEGSYWQYDKGDDLRIYRDFDKNDQVAVPGETWLKQGLVISKREGSPLPEKKKT